MDSTRDAQPAIEALRRRFRAQRPLRSGSLLMTIFGDAIAPRGGHITLGSLIRLAEPFGLAERLVRTAVARLAAEGWLVSVRAGRHSEYRLTETGRAVFAEATARIYAPNPSEWHGRWTLLALAAGRADRRGLRAALRWLGFGQITPGLYAHPALTCAQARAWLALRGWADAGWLFESRGESAPADRRCVSLAWDLEQIARRYRKFRDTFAPIAAARDLRALRPQSAFVVRTLLIHEYRKIHLRDPLLPPALLPESWIGVEAYALCAGLYTAVFAAAEHYLSEYGATLRGPLPPAGPESQARFGGLIR
jgi:phenylacetic acid degradation operon negative regulatory protein